MKLQPGDAPTNASRWSSPDLQREILKLLATEPRYKWTLRDRLCTAEARIFKELLALRKAGKVKLVGRPLDKRQWALVSYQDPKARVGVADPQQRVARKRRRSRFPRPLTERYADLLKE